VKVIVTGSRDFDDEACVRAKLDDIQPTVLIVGDCPTGADLFARRWWIGQAHVEIKVYKADWEALGKAAGPWRNRVMVQANRDADLGLAFFKRGAKNRGTAGCVALMREAGIKGRKITR
jgi:hypothetical protein